METVVKRKRKMVYNERSNRWEYQWVNVEKCVMAEADKIKVASEFFNGISAQELADRYHTTRLTIFSWVDRYSNGKERVSLSENQIENPMAKKNPEEEIKTLRTENKRLEKALELEKLRATVYYTMITVAEQTFNIPIRKKIWHQTVSLLRKKCKEIGLSTLCGLFGYSRQSYYKGSA